MATGTMSQAHHVSILKHVATDDCLQGAQLQVWRVHQHSVFQYVGMHSGQLGCSVMNY